MLASLRVRILLAALALITLALVINGIASYTTVKHHNNQQVSHNLSALAKGNPQVSTVGAFTLSSSSVPQDGRLMAPTPLPQYAVT